MNKLFFLIGLARSGKSTIAKRWVNYQVDIRTEKVIERECQQKSNTDNPRVIVNADSIRLTFGHRFHAPLEDYIHAIKHTMIKALLLSGHDVLTDGTHTSKHSIINLLEIDPDADYAMIKTPSDVCKERAIATDQKDLLPVIDRMAKQIAELPPVEDIRKEVKERYETIPRST